MIVDCFPFFNELDLLTVRLHELAGVVDKFVLTEATMTHSGKPKPLFFNENKDRYKDFPIDHVIIDSYDGIDLSWAWNLEHHQRDVGVTYAITRYALTRDDVVISSDADEIPAATAVTHFRDIDLPIMCLDMGLYYYYLNCYCPKRPWWYPKIFRVTDPTVSASSLRKRHRHLPRIKPGGWHFSYLGDIRYKIQSFAHQERNTLLYTDPARIMEIKREMKDLYDRNRKYPFTLLRDISYLPTYVKQHLWDFRKYIRETPQGVPC